MRRTIIPVFLLVLAVLLAAIGWRVGTSNAAADGTTPGGSATPVLSPRRVPVWLAAPVADQTLRASLDGVIQQSPPATCLVATAGTRPVYAHNPELLVAPASNQKIVTAAAALHDLGAGYRFRTRVLAAEPPTG